MISIIITAWKEPVSVRKAISLFLEQVPKNYELILVAPDKETLSVGKEFAKLNKRIRIFKDQALGKSEALNIAVKSAKGDVLVLSDGDVFIGKDSLNSLLNLFENPKIGAVTGRPITLNSRKNKYGFWAHILTQIAHVRRIRAAKKGLRFFCSGYLFAIRKDLFPHLPESLLSEDGFISHMVYSKGFRIAYSPKAEVFVKHPSNFPDWIIQKKRSAGGYNQIKKMLGVEMRSFKKESMGFKDFINYISNLRELYWVISLFIARFYLWITIFKDINLKKKSRKDIWLRVESTK